jgi:hypothetical protein
MHARLAVSITVNLVLLNAALIVLEVFRRSTVGAWHLGLSLMFVALFLGGVLLVQRARVNAFVAAALVPVGLAAALVPAGSDGLAIPFAIVFLVLLWPVQALTLRSATRGSQTLEVVPVALAIAVGLSTGVYVLVDFERRETTALRQTMAVVEQMQREREQMTATLWGQADAGDGPAQCQLYVLDDEASDALFTACRRGSKPNHRRRFAGVCCATTSPLGLAPLSGAEGESSRFRPVRGVGFSFTTSRRGWRYQTQRPCATQVALGRRCTALRACSAPRRSQPRESPSWPRG